jgi:hypothetical protein
MSQTPDQDRLDELEQETAAVRRQAEEHGTIPKEDPDPTFIDPDGDGEVDDDEAGTSVAL